MPTLLIKEVTCKGFSGKLKFQPKLGQHVGKAINADKPRDTPAKMQFSPGDRLFLTKLDINQPFEGSEIPAQIVEDDVCVFKTPPGKTLKVRYAIQS